MGSSTVSVDDFYSIPLLAKLLHTLPHLNVSLHKVNSTFNPESPIYLESLGILGSIPAAWLILTLLILLIYLLTRCCDRKPRPAKSISALKVTLAIVSVLCCAAIGLGLYGNDDLHNGVSQLIEEGRQVDRLISKIRNHTDALEKLLRYQASDHLTKINDILEEPVANSSAAKKCSDQIRSGLHNLSIAASAATDIRNPLMGISLIEKLNLGEKIEAIRWPFTMAVLSILLVLCVVLLVGVARHNRCALIAFSVCGLLAVIASYLMASVYLAVTVSLGDLCIAPDRYIEEKAPSNLNKEIIRYYASCESSRANPFFTRLRELKVSIDQVRGMISSVKKQAIELFPNRGLDPKFTTVYNIINEADSAHHGGLFPLLDCKPLHTHYVRSARALCNVGLLGLALMLASAVLSGLLLTVLVWVDSHTWIYIRKRKDYHQVNETDPYLPPPAASQAIAARTLQRSQGLSYPPDTPPPSYTSTMMLSPSFANVPTLHEAQLLIDGCDMRPSEHRGAHLSHLRGNTLGRLPSHHHESLSGPNNGKYATLSKQCKTLESSDFY